MSATRKNFWQRIFGRNQPQAPMTNRSNAFDTTELAALPVAQLCQQRDALEAELSRRALSLADDLRESRVHGPICGTGRSVTVISHDGASVLVAYYEDWSAFTVKHTAPQFPPIGDGLSGDDGRRFTGRQILPLAVYEGGSPAVTAWLAAEDSRRATEHDVWERSEYEKLRAKFGGGPA